MVKPDAVFLKANTGMHLLVLSFVKQLEDGSCQLPTYWIPCSVDNHEYWE